MSTYSVAGNAVANNARLRLVNTSHGVGDSELVTYTSSIGDYTFSSVPVGTYHLIADLNECSASPYNTGYVFRKTVSVSVVASNLTAINLTPVLLTSAS